METIKNLANRASNTLENSPNKTGHVSTNVKKTVNKLGIVKLFDWFQRVYGSAWASNLKYDGKDETDEIIALWTREMKHLNPKQVSYGANNLGKHFKTFPPTVFEFVDLCEQQGRSKYLTAAHKPWHSEPVKVAKRAVGEASLAKIKEELGA